MVQTPTALMVPLVVHGPDALKVTCRPEEEDALNVKGLPYCTFGKVGKVIVCDFVPEPCGRTMKVPETVLAGLKASEPGCDAVTVQLPVPVRVTTAEEILLTIV